MTARRGGIELKTRADATVAKGVISIPFCYAEEAAILLTNPALDPICKIPEYMFCASRMEIPPAAAAAE